MKEQFCWSDKWSYKCKSQRDRIAAKYVDAMMLRHPTQGAKSIWNRIVIVLVVLPIKQDLMNQAWGIEVLNRQDTFLRTFCSESVTWKCPKFGNFAISNSLNNRLKMSAFAFGVEWMPFACWWSRWGWVQMWSENIMRGGSGSGVGLDGHKSCWWS